MDMGEIVIQIPYATGWYVHRTKVRRKRRKTKKTTMTRTRTFVLAERGLRTRPRRRERSPRAPQRPRPRLDVALEPKMGMIRRYTKNDKERERVGNHNTLVGN